ncbi:hypothetical protein C8J57DRAFT_1520920 [Mycena rebaudengoi]|nr:hypothetical protein C8J57DRAFT_1520920 [Mycena rebaudengoi]
MHTVFVASPPTTITHPSPAALWWCTAEPPVALAAPTPPRARCSPRPPPPPPPRKPWAPPLGDYDTCRSDSSFRLPHGQLSGDVRLVPAWFSAWSSRPARTTPRCTTKSARDNVQQMPVSSI